MGKKRPQRLNLGHIFMVGICHKIRAGPSDYQWSDMGSRKKWPKINVVTPISGVFWAPTYNCFFGRPRCPRCPLGNPAYVNHEVLWLSLCECGRSVFPPILGVDVGSFFGAEIPTVVNDIVSGSTCDVVSRWLHISRSVPSHIRESLDETFVPDIGLLCGPK